MPSTVTTPIGARVPNEYVALLRQHAQRSHTTVSQIAATYIVRAIADEPTFIGQQRERQH